jgi:hypothetical protein
VRRREDLGFTLPRPHHLHEALERPHRPRAFAGKRRSEPVEEELLGALHDVRRQVVEAQAGGEPGKRAARMVGD